MLIMKASVVLCLISDAGRDDFHLLLVGLNLFPRSYCLSEIQTLDGRRFGVGYYGSPLHTVYAAC